MLIFIAPLFYFIFFKYLMLKWQILSIFQFILVSGCTYTVGTISIELDNLLLVCSTYPFELTVCLIQLGLILLLLILALKMGIRRSLFSCCCLLHLYVFINNNTPFTSYGYLC